MNSINPPMPSELTDPTPLGAIAGDVNDDDGPAIDEILEAAPHGPITHGTIPRETPDTIPAVTRIITRNIRIENGPAGDVVNPVMLFNADPNRQDLMIHFRLASNSVLIGSGRSEVLFSGNANAQLNALTATEGTIWRTDKHTGEVWIALGVIPGAPVAETLIISAYSVTK